MSFGGGQRGVELLDDVPEEVRPDRAALDFGWHTDLGHEYEAHEHDVDLQGVEAAARACGGKPISVGTSPRAWAGHAISSDADHTIVRGRGTMPPEPGYRTEPTLSKQTLLTVAEAADVAGVSRYQIGNWRRAAGLLPATVIHQTFLYDIADVRMSALAPAAHERC